MIHVLSVATCALSAEVPWGLGFKWLRMGPARLGEAPHSYRLPCKIFGNRSLCKRFGSPRVSRRPWIHLAAHELGEARRGSEFVRVTCAKSSASAIFAKDSVAHVFRASEMGGSTIAMAIGYATRSFQGFSGTKSSRSRSGFVTSVAVGPADSQWRNPQPQRAG